MSATMNVIFRGNAKRKAEREQEEAAPAEEVFSSQATRCSKREIQIQRRRETESGRDRQGERAKEAAAAARFRERAHSRSQRWERKEKREKRWKAREQRLLLQKTPCYVSRLHSHEAHKNAKRNKEKKKSAVLVWCLKSYVNKAH